MKDLYFSQIIKKARREHNMSQEELALLSGVSLATIRAIEQGTSSPNVNSLNKILKLFSLELTVTQINK